MTKDVFAAMKGQGTLVAAIFHHARCLQLRSYSDGSWEISNAASTVGLWEAEQREICVLTFQSLAKRMNHSDAVMWVRPDYGIVHPFDHVNLRSQSTATFLPVNQWCNMKDFHGSRDAQSKNSKLSSSIASPSEAVQPFRVLIVEDQPDSARLLKKLLERFGYYVAIAPSGQRALELASMENFDLIISDIGLPDFSGYELMRELRDRFGLIGMALTGFSGDTDTTKSAECGFIEHLVKPVDISDLYAAVERARIAKKQNATILPNACTN